MKILVSGGAGFIGSHTCVDLLNAGYEIAVFDNFYNSNSGSLEGIKKITGKDFDFYQVDMTDINALEEMFKKNKFHALIHFAGLKAVGESVEKPLLYYHTNIEGSVNLFKMCEKYGVNKIIFSSSATVYGMESVSPLKENFPRSVTNPYGRTKLIIEDILKDLTVSNKDLSVICLRYFNPVGAHESGLIGENPNGIPNNLMPRIVGTAAGKYDKLNVFGNDYDTPDGTCIRDYIHVSDLADGHLRALKYAFSGFKGIEAINLGRGKGVSVLELINAFEKTNNIKLNYSFAERRAGDVAANFADVTKAAELLGFKAEKSVEDMCRDSWNYYICNRKKGD